MKTYYKLLIYALIAATTNNFVWFALTFFAYLTTKSVVATGFVGGIYLVATASTSFWLGSLVDHHRKKNVMLASSALTLICFILGTLFYISAPENAFSTVESPYFWIFSLLLMAGVVSGNIIGIAIPSLVTHLVPVDRHDKANGLFGTVFGISFALTSAPSGIIFARGGMEIVMAISIVLTIVALVFLSFINISEKKIIHVEGAEHKKVDIKGTLKLVIAIPGLLALIFYSTFNNFIGGVFMALMDAYGINLIGVENWGYLLAVVSFGFIFGGLIIAKWGLGKNPVKTLFRVNILIWIVCILFTSQPSVILLFIGMMIWMTSFPFFEATEQTIIQKVVPAERQGRVFGFSQSVEQAASPLTAFITGPITQFLFIPFMTTGAGVELIGNWFGTGVGRGIALVFVLTGFIGLIVTLFAMRSKSYKLLAQKFMEK